MTAQREIEIEKEFRGGAKSQDFYAAKDWCNEHGFSQGSTDAMHPTLVGLMRGRWRIAKWRNMTPAERASLDGLMTGDFRNGPVRVTIFKKG